jgi:hypothetical protein
VLCEPNEFPREQLERPVRATLRWLGARKRYEPRLLSTGQLALATSTRPLLQRSFEPFLDESSYSWRLTFCQRSGDSMDPVDSPVTRY